MEKSTDIPNIAMADTFMKIFGYKRVKPTDEELKRKYKYKEKDVNLIMEYLNDLSS